MNELYVIRHGETEWNTQKRYQGQMNSPLTERGRQKILEQKEHLSGLTFRKVYCSPLGRCRQTLDLLTPRADEIVFDDRLMEFHLGVLQGKTYDQVPENHQKQQAFFWEDPEAFELEGAESFQALEERVKNLLKEIEQQEGLILFITHTVIIKMLFKILEERQLCRLWDDPHLFPGSLIRFSRDRDRLTFKNIIHPKGQGKPVRAYTA